MLGVPPAGPQLRGLVSAMLRLDPSDDVRGLRSAVAAALELDEAALADDRRAPTGCDDVQMALLDALAARELVGGSARPTRAPRCSAAPTPTSRARCASPARSSCRGSRRRPTS